MFNRNRSPSSGIMKSKAANNLTTVFIWVQIITLISFFIVYEIMNFKYHQHLAKLLVESVRNAAIMGDYRNVIATLNMSFKNDFEGVALYTTDNHRVFSLPPSQFHKEFLIEDYFSLFINNKIIVPIEFNEKLDTMSSGEFIFIYPRFSFFWLWGGTAFTTLFFGSWILRKTKNHLMRDQEVMTLNRISSNRLKMAQQVSHDIRSPLSALNMITSQLNMVPETHRSLLINATQRINDIANALLIKTLSEIPINSSPTSNNSVTMLGSLLEKIISEKRIQHQLNQNISISFDLKDSYGIFIDVNPVEFQRMISNLIENSIEAIENHKIGYINVLIKKNQQLVVIEVVDNGKGIPPTILTQLKSEGVSYGKSGGLNGFGLGLNQARKTVTHAGGNMEISSELNHGTTIQLNFPHATAPKWYLNKLVLKGKKPIIIIDDDKTIYELWHKRFQDERLNFNRLNYFDTFNDFNLFNNFKNNFITYFSNPDELVNCFKYKMDSSYFTDALFLVDFEFSQNKRNGIDIIKELNLVPHSILVTHRFDEYYVQAECLQLDLKILPKNQIPWVPIDSVAHEV